MDNNKDLLQIKIEEARATLPQKMREAIDFVNWKIIILGMLGKYSPVQLEVLEDETELLLCGLIEPQNYPEALEKGMHLSKEGVTSLVEEMDRLVFQKILKELERRVIDEEKVPFPNKKTTLDPRFNDLPENIKKAIAESDYQVALYTMGSKYKLKVEQMGVLEEITIKVILGEISPDKYEAELASKITIGKEDLSNLVNDVNENILKKIREGERIINNEELRIKNEGKKVEEIPLPPYEIIKKEKLIINNVEKTEDEVPVPSYAEEIKNDVKVEDEIPLPPQKLINNEELIIENEKEVPKTDGGGSKPKETIVGISDAPLNIMAEKLKGVTMSEHTVSDHSLPKVNSVTDINKDDIKKSTSKTDPYREAI